jgi:Zn-dependent protease
MVSESSNMRILANRVNGGVIEQIHWVLPVAMPMSVGFSMRRENDIDHPAGRDHFERWTILEDGAGSQVEVTTQIRKTPIATLRTLLSLRRRAGLLARGRTVETRSMLKPRAPRNAHHHNGPPNSGRPPPRRRWTGSFNGGNFQRDAAVSLIAFAILLLQFSWQSAVVLAAVILWHEYGHLLSYQLTGRRGNSLMLVPFFGGVAVAGAPHKNEFERAFCALAGPGICAPVTAAAFGLWFWTDNPIISDWAWRTLYFSAVLNLLNLLPIYPLDGGHAVESFLRTYRPDNVPTLMTALSIVGLVIVGYAGYYQTCLILALFALLSLRSLSAQSHLPKLTGRGTLLIAAGYAVVAAVHGLGFYFILNPPPLFH